ncbi:MAG: hypothetical protein WAT74_14935 [Flavobacteriales bacterium]
MIITERFVMLNFPKTGSSFARQVVKQAHFHHPPSLRQRIGWRLGAPQRMLKDVLVKPNLFNAEQAARAKEVAHGAYSQIPVEHRNKTIVTVVREPMARLVSLYEFKAWAKALSGIDAVHAAFPQFPELSFAEYFDLQMGAAYQASIPPGMRTEVGPLTLQFIRMFAHDPLRTALALHDGLDLRREWRAHFPRIHFLRNEHLNAQLRSFLLGQGYTRESLRFIDQKERVNRTDRSQARYFTPAMMQEVRHRERFFYQLFPDYLRAFDSPTTA